MFFPKRHSRKSVAAKETVDEVRGDGDGGRSVRKGR